MMFSANYNPSAAMPNLPAMPLPFFDIWSGIANLYRDAMEASTQQMMLSSAGIIQEHTLRAFMDASRACSEALAKNAMTVQQQSMGRFADANQKAMEMMGRAFTQAWMGNMQSAR